MRRFYAHNTNGLLFGGSRIFPIEDHSSRGSIKKTWDSVTRNNNPGHSAWFGGDPAALSRFLIFAAADDNGCEICFAFKKDTANIWQWNADTGETENPGCGFDDWLVRAMRREAEISEQENEIRED